MRYTSKYAVQQFLIVDQASSETCRQPTHYPVELLDVRPANFVCSVALWYSITPRPQMISTNSSSTNQNREMKYSETYSVVSRWQK